MGFGMKLIIYFVILLSMIGFAFQQAVLSSQPPHKAFLGKMDVTQWDLETRGKVYLDGEWEFYWGRLLSPRDFDKEIQQDKQYLGMPGLWTELNEMNSSITQSGQGTFRLLIDTKQKYESLSLFVPAFGSAYRLWIDGQQVVELGEMDAAGNVQRAIISNNLITFKPRGTRIEIIINVANIEPIFPGTTKSIELGISAEMTRLNYLALAQEMFLFGAVIIISIYHFVLYLLRRKDISTLFFSLLCFFASFRIILYSRVASDLFFKDVSWNIIMKAYCITTTMAFLVLLLYVNFIFKAENSSKLLKLLVALHGISSILALILPIRFIGLVSVGSNALIAFALVYITVVLLRAIANKQEGAFLIVLAGLIIIGAVTLDLLYSWHFIKYSRFTAIGIFLFIIIQSFYLSRKFSMADYKAEKLAVEVMEHKLAREEVVSAYNEIDWLSRTDYLTKLSNRRDIHEKIEMLIAEFERTSYPFAVVLCDIDEFKQINDQYGHDMGDFILTAIADIMKKALREGDLVGRWGGEEFILVLPCWNHAGAESIVERIRRDVQDYLFQFNNQIIQTTITFGLCFFDGSIEIDKCISQADEALYQGKRNGKNQIVIWNNDKKVQESKQA